MKRMFFLLLLVSLLLSSCVTSGGENQLPEIMITSTAFEEGSKIPSEYGYRFDNISPPLQWTAIPEGTVSYVIICDDPDAPNKTWVHWVLYNLPGDLEALPEAIPMGNTLEMGGFQGKTDFGETGYGGPSPPSGVHRYFFKIYALDTLLDLPAGKSKADVMRAMEGHILGKGSLMGRFSS